MGRLYTAALKPYVRPYGDPEGSPYDARRARLQPRHYRRLQPRHYNRSHVSGQRRHSVAYDSICDRRPHRPQRAGVSLRATTQPPRASGIRPGVMASSPPILPGRQFSRACSSTAGGCTSSGTCSTCGSSATTSRIGSATSGFLVFYLFCGAAAALGQVMMNPPSVVPMIGASGAIAGVMGAYFVFYPQSRVLTAVFVVVLHGSRRDSRDLLPRDLVPDAALQRRRLAGCRTRQTAASRSGRTWAASSPASSSASSRAPERPLNDTGVASRWSSCAAGYHVPHGRARP